MKIRSCRNILSLFLMVGATISLDNGANAAPDLWWSTAWLGSARGLSEGQDVLIAEVDSGAETSLPQLQGALVPGLEIGSGKPADGKDQSEDGHGTKIAVLLAGRQVDGDDLVGVAPKAKVMPLVGGDGGVGTAKAIEASVRAGASVINMSYVAYEPDCPAMLQQAIYEALDAGVVLIAGSGNDGLDLNYSAAPALCAGVVAVGAVDRSNAPWLRTQKKDYVDLAAPGVEIASVDPRGHVSSEDGTSFSAALVSGVVALLRARFPQMPARQIVTRLLATAKDAGPPGRDDQTGMGIVQPYEALTAEVPVDAPNEVYDEVDRVRGKVTGRDVPGAAAPVETRSNTAVVGAAAAGGAVLLAVLAVLVRRRRR